MQWDLQADLEMFMTTYMEHISPDFVNLSIGLRALQLYEETKPMIMKIPDAFISSLIQYFEKMEAMGKIAHDDFACLAMTIDFTTANIHCKELMFLRYTIVVKQR